MRYYAILIGLALCNCAPSDAELDRKPLVRSVQSGPLLLRFYASSTSTGGSATRFQTGDAIYLVSTTENNSAEPVLCKPSFEKDTFHFPSCGTPRTKLIRQRDEIVWSDDVEYGMCLFSHDLESYFPDQITLPVGVIDRSSTKMSRKKPLEAGEYTLEWHPAAGFSFPTLCDYPLETTRVTIPIEIYESGSDTVY